MDTQDHGITGSFENGVLTISIPKDVRGTFTVSINLNGKVLAYDVEVLNRAATKEYNNGIK